MQKKDINAILVICIITFIAAAFVIMINANITGKATYGIPEQEISPSQPAAQPVIKHQMQIAEIPETEYEAENNLYAENLATGHKNDYVVLGPSENEFYSDIISSFATGFDIPYYEGEFIFNGVDEIPPNPGRSHINKAIEIIPLSSGYIELYVNYDEQDLNGVAESSLRLYRYNNEWTLVENSYVDTAENYVYAELTDFSIFAPFGTTSGGVFCGDNIVNQQSEQCDGNDLNGQSCQSLNPLFTGGTLSCTYNCLFDTSSCISAEPFCGDGIKNNNEECDLNDFGSLTCSDYGYNQGNLLCNQDCTVDTSSCYTSSGGGGGSSGGSSGGGATETDNCASTSCEYCATQQACENVGCFWENTRCVSSPVEQTGGSPVEVPIIEEPVVEEPAVEEPIVVSPEPVEPEPIAGQAIAQTRWNSLWLILVILGVVAIVLYLIVFHKHTELPKKKSK